MSRGFVKEDDQEEPVFIPPRAPLPQGFENLVTPNGLQLLAGEKAALENSRAAVDLPDGPLRRRELAEINGRIALVEQRIASARVVGKNSGGADDVRFGCTVSFRIIHGPQQGTDRTFTLVGVDEARINEGKIAYTAPIAQALLGRKAGETFDFVLGAGIQHILVTAVA